MMKRGLTCASKAKGRLWFFITRDDYKIFDSFALNFTYLTS